MIRLQAAALREEFPAWQIWHSHDVWMAHRASPELSIIVHLATATEMQDRLRALDGQFNELADLAARRVIW